MGLCMDFPVVPHEDIQAFLFGWMNGYIMGAEKHSRGLPQDLIQSMAYFMYEIKSLID